MVQEAYSFSPDQRWLMVQVKDNVFLIQSVANKEYYLGPANERGGSSATMVNDKTKCLWMIDGFFS